MWKIFNFFTIISFKYFHLGVFLSWLDEPLSTRLWNTWAHDYMFNCHKNSDFKNYLAHFSAQTQKEQKDTRPKLFLIFPKMELSSSNLPEFREKKNKCRFCKTGTGRVIVRNVICTFVWAIQETVLLVIIANNCDNSHDIGQGSNHLLFSNIYAFGEMILLHNDYFDDNTYVGFYF